MLPLLAPPIPENCRTCGLYQNCKTWKVKARGSQTAGPVDVLFVGQNPGQQEDEQGRPFVGDTGAWLSTYLTAIQGVSYALTNAVKCAYRDGGRNLSPKKEHVEACRPYMAEDISYWRPRIVVALGAVALQSVWPSGPSTLTKARGAHKMGDYWLLVTDHPSRHIRGEVNLTAEYDKLFDLICRILADDGATKAEHSITICDTWQAVQDSIAHLVQSPFLTCDFEVSTCKADPLRKTVWHPHAEVLTVAWCGEDRKAFVWPLNHPESPFSDTEWEARIPPVRGRTTATAYWFAARRKGMRWTDLFKKAFEQAIGAKTLIRRSGVESAHQRTFVAHNCKYDLNVLQIFYDIVGEDRMAIEDTFLKHYALDQSYIGNNLGDLANRYLSMPSWWDAIYPFVDSVPGKQGSFADIPLSVLAPYNAMDVIATEGLRQASQTWDVPRSYEFMLRVSRTIRRMEVRGVPANALRLEAVEKVYQARYGSKDEEDCDFLKTLLQFPVAHAATTYWQQKWDIDAAQMRAEGKVEESVLLFLGNRPNTNKPSPYSERFVKALAQLTGFETTERTKKGALSYNAAAIMHHASVDKYGHNLKDSEGADTVPFGDPLIDIWRLLLRWRKGRTLLSLFINPIRQHIIGGRIHANFNLGKAEQSATDAAGDVAGGAETGRLSSRDPNLLAQKNDPILLDAYEAAPDEMLAKWDYAQVELRRMADKFGVQSLIQAFRTGLDPYKAAACDMWGLEYTEVSKDRRDASKRNILARIYLEGVQSLAKRNKVAPDVIEEVNAKLDAAMPELAEGIEACFAAVDRGAVFETGWGRRRTFQENEKRSAWNFPIQSECADLTEQKLCELDDMVLSGELECSLPLLIVHDAILLEMGCGSLLREADDSFRWPAPLSPLWRELALQRRCLLDPNTLPITMNVPLGIDLEIGPRWGKMKKVDVVDGGAVVVFRHNLGKEDKPIWLDLARVEGEALAPL